MKRVLFILTVVAAACTLVCAQNTMRRGLKLRGQEATNTAVSVACDTVSAPTFVAVSGYDKPLRSRRESVFVANSDTARTLHSVELEITYTDMQNHMLHRRTKWVTANAAPGERRLLTFPSWDVQCVFYYHQNQPYRPRTQATPYKVSIRVLRATTQ